MIFMIFHKRKVYGLVLVNCCHIVCYQEPAFGEFELVCDCVEDLRVLVAEFTSRREALEEDEKDAADKADDEADDEADENQADDDEADDNKKDHNKADDKKVKVSTEWTRV